MSTLDVIKEYDAKVRARAREVSKLNSAAEIRAWFVANDRPLDEGDNPYAAALGVLQALTHELLRDA